MTVPVSGYTSKFLNLDTWSQRQNDTEKGTEGVEKICSIWRSAALCWRLREMFSHTAESSRRAPCVQVARDWLRRILRDNLSKRTPWFGNSTFTNALAVSNITVLKFSVSKSHYE
jgi:hypothetical protein